MRPFQRCPVCGGEIAEKEVEKLLRGDVNTAIMRVPAEVCLHCGECLYAEETVKQFEEIRGQLKRGESSTLKPIGQSFQVT